MTDISKRPAPTYSCATKGCPSEPFRLGHGAGRDPHAKPRCGSCYQWIRRWLKRNPKADPKTFQEPPVRPAAERPVERGSERKRRVSAYVLPELAELLEKRWKEEGWESENDFVVFHLAKIVKRGKDLGPRKPKKPVKA